MKKPKIIRARNYGDKKLYWITVYPDYYGKGKNGYLIPRLIGNWIYNREAFEADFMIK